MIWGEETAGATDRFEPAILPPATALDLEHTAVLGVGAAAPRPDPLTGPAGLREVDASAGKTAWRRRLAPHHRRVVKTFFDSSP